MSRPAIPPSSPIPAWGACEAWQLGVVPATQSYTYRQKAQRAFAAEMLAPIDAVDDFLEDDRSEDRYNDAAEHFNVSQMVISSLLRNNHRL